MLLELNEFNLELLEKTSRQFNLLQIQKLLRMHKSDTITEDSYESDFLEPWVQWVSVHTGKPSSAHNIKHLGDVPHLGTQQIWEILSAQGISSGVWGAMNASRGTASNCHFFLPDPWTASERACPEQLNQLLDPLRFASKNYLGNTAIRLVNQLKGLIRLVCSYGLGNEILKEIPSLLRRIIRFRGAHFVFIAFVEYLSTRLFLQVRKKFNPSFSLLFINTLAHLQHHYWTGFDYEKNEKLKCGLQLLDRMLGSIFSSMEEGEVFLVANALSQKNTNDEKPWILYRPLEHRKLLHQAGIIPSKIEALMTHDAHLFFDTAAECQQAVEILKGAQIKGQRFFLVETYPDFPTKLFFRIDFTDKVSHDAVLLVNRQKLRFFDFYKAIVERTGKHIQTGTLLCSRAGLPSCIKNHEIFDVIVHLFQIKGVEIMGERQYIKKS